MISIVKVMMFLRCCLLRRAVHTQHMAHSEKGLTQMSWVSGWCRVTCSERPDSDFAEMTASPVQSWSPWMSPSVLVSPHVINIQRCLCHRSAVLRHQSFWLCRRHISHAVQMLLTCHAFYYYFANTVAHVLKRETKAQLLQRGEGCFPLAVLQCHVAGLYPPHYLMFITFTNWYLFSVCFIHC